ncbi:glycosyltransferase family 2 protein [Psychroflexus sp. YR1-1]|uniref:Glycosyltransferase family 2 protein n=1 Tax=Psychroflexus aurantiacus TaxID=2709310 RepID=A0A6B3R078_9FLAO|nr:glycosyltransferase family 2 protein [Psychroflexus aurantiacus]NEV93946.1 glycosyltransferase family 2 protein [Psychroflexus aurantiacus]
MNSNTTTVTSDNPLVSIIIPTYNRAHLIEETLDSVLAQTYRNWECIIVDDGSSDNTDDVVGTYVKKGSRFRYYHRPEEHLPGGNGARNFGFKMSQSAFIIFLDSDDIIAKDCLDNRVKVLEINNLNMDMLISHSASFKNFIGDTNILWNKIDSTDSYLQLMIRFLNMDMPWSTNGVLWKKTFLNKIGLWEEDLWAWQDWDLHFRALAFKPKLCYNLKKPDNFFRVGTTHFNIGKKYKSLNYIKSVEKALNNVSEIIFKLDTKDKERIKPHFDRLVLKMLLKFSMLNDRITYPIKSLFKLKKLKTPYYYEFLSTYLTFLLCKSFKIKKFILKSTFKKKQENLKIKSTYLKIKVNDVSFLNNTM